MNTDYIIQFVAGLRKRYSGLSIAEMCDAMGIQVLYYPMGTKHDACKGFFIRRFSISCITVNSDLCLRNQEIILAHEMGHACLHDHIADATEFVDVHLDMNSGVYEHEANLFAAELLLPDQEVLEKIQEMLPVKTISEELMVPPALIDYKARILQKKGIPVHPGLFAQSSFIKDIAG